MTRFIAIAFTVLFMTACAPEVGSQAWCESLDERDKGDWTANEIADYAKHCIFRKRKE